MGHTFDELVLGGVLIAPFVTYLLAALIAVIVLRPLLHLAGFARIFSNASLAELALYVTILCLLMLFF